MLKPTDVADAIVAKLQAIAALATALGGIGNIRAYRDAWPASSYLWAALVEMKAPVLLVVWKRTGPGSFEGHVAREHEFSLIIRPPETVPGGADYGDIIKLIEDGVPADGEGNRLAYETIHPGCYPMNIPLLFERQTLAVSPEAAIDYYESHLVLVEIGNQ